MTDKRCQTPDGLGVLYRVNQPSIPLSQKREGGRDTTLLFGESVMVYESGLVQALSDHYVGYIEPNHISHYIKPTHYVQALSSHIYPKPSFKVRHNACLPMLAQIAVENVIEGRPSFARLVTGGYVPVCHLRELDVFESDFVSVAYRFLGVPYLWGGKTYEGIDCSGLIQIALQSSGLFCPRDSDQQLTQLGKGVDMKSLQRGDLIFWQGHVGVMVSDLDLLHANIHHMCVAQEPLAQARERIAMPALARRIT